MEAVFAVTPSETIKYVSVACSALLSWSEPMCRTKLIDDAKSPNPKYRGLIDGTSQIVRTEGIRGIYRGFVPVVRTPGSRPTGLAHTDMAADDAPIGQLRRPVHNIYRAQAGCAGPDAARRAAPGVHHVRHRRGRGDRDRVLDHAA
jgi:hypothetical protein